MARSTKRSNRNHHGLAWGVAGLAAGLLATPASAIGLPNFSGLATGLAVNGQSAPATVIEVHARGGRGGIYSGGHFRGGGHHFRGGHSFGGHSFGRGIGVPLLLAPAIGYGGYSYYNNYYSDCRTVRVKERRCWVDDDGDKECGVRWVVRRYCD